MGFVVVTPFELECFDMRGLWKHFILGTLLSLFFAAGWVIKFGPREPEVLSGFVEESVTPTVVPTPTPTPTLIPSPTSIPTPIPTPIPSPTVIPTPSPVPPPPVRPEAIHGFIERFAAQYNVDPNVLRHIAVCESGFNPMAVKLSYAGLYQFGPTAWGKYRGLIGEDESLELRFNAEEATQTAAYVLSINQAYIWPNCTP